MTTVMGPQRSWGIRTRGDAISDGLRARRERGLRVGRPRACPDDILSRAVGLKAAGARLADIAEAFNSEGVPTPGGRPTWNLRHVSRLLQTQDAIELRLAAADPDRSADAVAEVDSIHR